MLLQPVIEIGRAAADRIEAAGHAGIIVEEKRPGHPVTAADRETDRFLRERLMLLLSCGWLSEETTDSRDRLSQRRVWVVDPLDGTKEFAAGVPEYAVSVALVEDHHPVLGVVVHAASRAAYWAVRGSGAYAEGRRVHVTDGDRLLASRTELARGEFDAFERDWRIEPSGSIALKLARVAAGEAAATLSRGPKAEWDVCAGSLIVEEAAGIVTSRDGAPLLFNTESARVDGIVAGAASAHRRTLDTVRRLQRMPGAGREQLDRSLVEDEERRRLQSQHLFRGHQR